MNYDVILLAGFGGPRQLADVVPFLRNVTAGKAIPDARLEQVGAHYRLFDGHSPINEQTEALRDALAAALLAEGIKLPVVIGNRNWHPFTIDGRAWVLAGRSHDRFVRGESGWLLAGTRLEASLLSPWDVDWAKGV